MFTIYAVIPYMFVAVRLKLQAASSSGRRSVIQEINIG